MRLRGTFDQAHGDAHARTFAPGTPFEEVVGTQGFGDLARPLQTALEEHRRPAPDDPDLAATERAELRDQLLGEPVAEEFLATVVAQIAERQHHQAWSRHWRCGFCATSGSALHFGDEPITP